MDNSKHTPGPWAWQWKPVSDLGWRNGALVSESIPNGQYNKTILSAHHYPRNDGEANAALIASAPDLLTKNAELSAENRRLRELLLKYADHLDNCRHRTISSDDYDSVLHCECGYSKIDYGSAALSPDVPESEEA